MPHTDRAWNQVSTDPLIQTFEYSFGPGTANSLAVGVAGGVIVASPPCGVGDPVIRAMDAFGGVRALIATNAFHHLGLRAWKERYPDAPVFAPAQAIARVAARSGVKDIRPLDEAGALAGERVSLTDMPHYKTGEALIRIRTAEGLAWYVTDVIMNLARLPANPVIKLLFGLSGTAPGLRLNNIAPLFMVQDKAALRSWLRAQAERDRPRWLIPAHGDVVDLGPTAAPLCSLFGAGSDVPD
jgi:glyoxylase-like metal-dependent hydrolase (beta-lactamase superfamily II)